jgi:hypothetical protein
MMIPFASQPDRHLPERMYEYHRRIVDRHQQRVVSPAVLADASPGFRPAAYEKETWGCRLRFEYPICKLRDFTDAALEREDNPIAIVMAAHRAAQRRAQDPLGLKAVKWRLIRRLYERDYTKNDVIELFRLIDWLIQLPAKLAVEINSELAEYEDQRHMPYITSIERMGREEGLQQGLQQGRQEGRQEGFVAARQKAVVDALEIRFCQVPDGMRERVEAIQDEARLRALLKSAIQVESIEEFGKTF